MVQWAPLFIPLERRLQTLAVFMLISTVVLCILALIPIIMFWPLWPFGFCYLIYMALDWNTPSNGGRRTALVRFTRQLTRPWFRFYSAYFPASLSLDPAVPEDTFTSGKKFLFAIHPHGWIGSGIWATWLTEGCNIRKLLPKIDFRAVTLKSNFSVPFWRDFVMLHGLCDCSAQSIRNLFKQNLSVFIVPGGARESLYARPSKKVSLVLEKRSGFVRVAIENGAQLVPVFSFGEESLYNQVDNHKGTLVRKVQDLILAWTGIAFPLVNGRGIFNYSFGLLPHRKPIHVVIGVPIETPSCSNPTTEMVEKVHSEYKDALRKLFETHKAKYGYGDQELEYV